jgi:hypothetical protein
MRLMRGLAAVLAIAAIALAVRTQVALAEPTTHLFDSCSTTCGSGGGCSASTEWYEFWKECDCHCGNASGTAICSCGGEAT